MNNELLDVSIGHTLTALAASSNPDDFADVYEILKSYFPEQVQHWDSNK